MKDHTSPQPACQLVGQTEQDDEEKRDFFPHHRGHQRTVESEARSVHFNLLYF